MRRVRYRFPTIPGGSHEAEGCRDVHNVEERIGRIRAYSYRTYNGVSVHVIRQSSQSQFSNSTEYICEHVCLCRFQSLVWHSVLRSSASANVFGGDQSVLTCNTW